MFIPLMIAVLCGVAYVAWIGMGDTDPPADSSPEFDTALDDMDNDPDPEPDPEPTPAPDKPVDDPAPGKGGEDKTVNWSKDMSDFEQYIPDELKHKFNGRVEQGGRWGKGAPDGDPELQAKFDALDAQAREFASWLQDGEADLERMGTIEFLKAFQTIDPKTFVPKDADPDPQAPVDDDDDRPQWAKDIQAEHEKLKAEKAQLLQDAKDKAEVDRLEAEFLKGYNPALEKALEGISVKDADKKAVSKQIDTLAKAFYIWQANEKPGSATPEGCVKAAIDAIDTIVNARLANGPKAPEGTVLNLDPEAVTDPLEGDDFDAQMEAFSNDFDRDTKAKR